MQDVKLNRAYIKQSVKAALKEDIASGDITSKYTIGNNYQANFTVTAKEDLILCGLDFFLMAFAIRNKKTKIKCAFKEGDLVKKGATIITGSGPIKDILASERVGLNYLQHMSGIATTTSKFVKALNNKKIAILDTRKTIPNYRLIAKYAVKIGGGHNHRFGLYDAILIKDNHIKAAGSITEAIHNCRKKTKMPIEVECETLSQVEEALEAKAEIIMLDNMGIKETDKAIKLINKRAKIEISGNINLETIKKYSNKQLDYISAGALTHSPRASDLSLNIEI